MMTALVEKLFDKGRQKGFQDQEIYYVNNKNLTISVYEGEIDKYSLSENSGLSFRALIDGKMGYAYTEIFDEAALEMLVREVYDNAKAIEVEDRVFLHDGSGSYVVFDGYNEKLSQTPINDKINLMMDLERAIKNKDFRVLRVSNNLYAEGESERWIKNTKGLDVKDRVNYCYAMAMPIVSDGQDTRTGLGYDVSNDFGALSLEHIASSGTEQALNMLGAVSTKSRNCPVVIKNSTFAEFFSEYMGLYSAENVQKNLSALKGKLNEKIASDVLTLVDDPHMALGLSSSSFDAEGVATYKKEIISKGVLNTYLHNLKTAFKEGVKSTGNASKGSYKGTVGISASNLVIQPGQLTFEQMISDIEFGVYVISLQGLHAGIDAISGDFSLQCYGYLIEGGKLGKPVSQITVSGNYFELLKEIEAIANDFEFSLIASDYTGSGSVKIKSLTISGE